jgi:HAD superfamily hydrolase (TIGR01509 family)
MTGMKRLVIFDFDGVIADSEVVANTVLAEVISELGVPTTLDEAMRLYMGKRFHEVIAAIEAAVGCALPEDFGDRLQARTLLQFRRDLRLIEGVLAYIEAFPNLLRCIASSSSADRLAVCLETLTLTKLFGSNVYSASEVVHGKPHPGIFLYAAKKMAVDPSACIVIEDSVTGVEAGVAAGMTVIGLTAASHIRSGHGERLKAAGAHYVAQTFADAQAITQLLASTAQESSFARQVEGRGVNRT